MAKFDNESQAVRTVRSNGNTIGDRKIYLRANRLEGADNPAVTSAGLKMWSAIDYLLAYHKYSIIYEVAGEKKAR